MKPLNEYETPETDKLHDEFIADDKMPHLFAYQRAVEKSECLERRLARFRAALGEIAKLADEMPEPSDESEIAMIALKMIESQ